MLLPRETCTLGGFSQNAESGRSMLNISRDSTTSADSIHGVQLNDELLVGAIAWLDGAYKNNTNTMAVGTTRDEMLEMKIGNLHNNCEQIQKL